MNAPILKKIYALIIGLFLMLMTQSVWAENLVINENIFEYKKNISIDESLKIDLSDLKNTLEEENIILEWSSEWEETVSGEVFEKNFEKTGKKEISLSVFSNETGEKRFILSSQIDAFVYDVSVPFIFSDKIEQQKIDDFIEVAGQSWVYMHNMWVYKEKELLDTDFSEILSQYKWYSSAPSDYIWIWWEKEFIFSVLSKINTLNIPADRKLNIVAISWFNTNILKNYLNNFVSNKNSIWNVVIMNDSVKFQIVKNPASTSMLESELENNWYDFLKIEPGNDVSEVMFVSKFINNLSNKGFSTSDIYILILLPFLFTLVSFFKHFIWISPMGLIITVLFSVLFFKVWALASTVVMASLLFINLWISKLISKQTLLYTPKISFIIVINIVIFTAIMNLLFKYSILDVNLSDTIYIILFIIVSERLINVIVSKEFREYKNNLTNTFIIAIFAYMIFSIAFVKVFILAYPEIIILLAPANFIMWRFTWLRITEYLRFKEVIKSIEEE